MCTNGISLNVRFVLLEEELGMSKFISFKGNWINKLLDGTGVSLISVLQLCLELLLAVAVQEKMNPNCKPQSRCYFRGTITYMFLEILISCCVEWHQHGRLHFSCYWKHQCLLLVQSRTGISQKLHEHC